MYKRLAIPPTVEQYIEQIKSGISPATGGTSPYAIDGDVLKAIEASGDTGVELELVAVAGVSGGTYAPDDQPFNQTFLGSFNCRLKHGATNKTTFANLGAADVVTFMLTGGKTVCKVVTPQKNGEPVKNKAGQLVKNITPIAGVIFERGSAAHIAALGAITKLVPEVAKTTPPALKA